MCQAHNNQERDTKRKMNIPGSIPSVFGAPVTGAKMVTFFMVTFLQSYG